MDEQRCLELLTRLEKQLVRVFDEFGRYANGALGQHTRDIRELEERVNTLENEVGALKRREAAHGK